MRPAHVLLFLLSVLGLLALIGAVLPADGLQLGDALTVRLPTAREMLFPEKQERVDISAIEALATDTGTAAVADTALQPVVAPPTDQVVPLDTTALPSLAERSALHHAGDDRATLHPFYRALERARHGKRPMHILHFGDSQIEGDRITSYVRNKLQKHFGGHGPGLVAVADIVPHFSVDRELEGDWKRYSMMGRRDPTQPHKRFGLLGAFSRFTPILPDSASLDSAEVVEASITLRPNKRAYGRAGEWTVCRLYHGWHRAPVTITVHSDGELVSEETIDPANELLTREWHFPATPGALTIAFRGADSPDVYGLTLEGHSGVCMDNLAARGASGLEIRQTDQAVLNAMVSGMDVGLVVLQFGGNVLPHMKTAEEAEQYGRSIGAQIKRYKQLVPNVPVLVIGPSDMSIKEGDAYVTRPFLEDVRDAMKTHTLAQGGVFWDLYATMGGRNSMASWVTAKPPLAATDYTHFSPQGAAKVGELLYAALINDHAAYLATRKSKKEPAPTPPKPAAPQAAKP